MNNIASIMIVGKRWFDRTHGNTYCSSQVFINGELAFKIPWTYGYGNYYEQKAKEILNSKGIIKLEKYSNGCLSSFREYCEKNKIKYETIVTDGLKRDMVAWGEKWLRYHNFITG